MTYTLLVTVAGKFLVRSTDNAVIPATQTNADYQAYLAWLALGNTAPPGAPTS